MREAHLLVVLVEIAGVFVGFGALIAVRSGGPSDTWEVSYIRSVLSFGVWVMVAGLTPVVLGGYDFSGHELWLVCALVALVVWWGTMVAQGQAPENRAVLEKAGRSEALRMVIGFWPFVVVITGALVLVVLGLFPEQQAALYLTAVVAGLFGAASMLFMLVFGQSRTMPANLAEPPAE
jgi:hypothetical protein